MMATKTASETPPQDVALTLEDVACLADGNGDLPDATAARLRTLIRCDDQKLIQRTWRRRASQLEELHQMAADAGVELLVDGLYLYRILEQLRSKPWQSTSDVLDPRLDVPYQELITMAGALAERARGDEQAELRQLIERLKVNLSDLIGGDKILEHLVGRLLEAGDEAAEEALRELVGIYRHRRAVVGGHP